MIVERDHWGVPHIRASSVEDMVEAQGYVMAQDRLWQMDLLRRVGARRTFRNPRPRDDRRSTNSFARLGFGRAAERDLPSMEPDRSAR